MPTPETRVKLKLINQLERLRKTTPLWHAPWSNRYVSGVPDRVVIIGTLHHCNVVFIECKAPGKPLRKLQQKTIEAMRYAGARVRVYRGEEIKSLEDIHHLPME